MSERNGYEHGVPSWIAGAHADPDRAAAFYTELFGWDAERRGEHLVCTLRGRDVAGFVRGDERRLAHPRLGRERRRRPPRARRTPAARVARPSRSTSPAVGRTAVLADPAGAVFIVASPTPTAAPRSSTSRARGR